MNSLRPALLGMLIWSAAAFGPCASWAQRPEPALMPRPVSVQPEAGALRIDGPLLATWTGCGARPWLDRGLARLENDLVRQTGVAPDPASPVPLNVRCLSARAGADVGEAYRLKVGAAGIEVEADGPAGVIRAFATLRQLAGLAPAGLSIDAVAIDDRPRFAWRGVMLDVVRHFVSIDTIKRQIDAMERVKLNVLHLHLSDSQAFRVESRRFPKLTAGLGRDYYSHEQIRDLVSYAAERGVRIVPEFDVPGHTEAIIAAYPDIGVVAPRPDGRPPVQALNPASPATYRFLTGVIGEMAGLFPDPYFHVGGDEVAPGVWDAAPDVQALMAREGLKDSHEVEAYFHRRVQKIVAGAGKTMMGWDEVGYAGVPKDVVIEAWRSSNSTANAVGQGHRTVVSAGYYLDLLMPAAFHYAVDPLDVSAAGLSPDYAARLRSLGASHPIGPLIARFVTEPTIRHPLPPLTAEQEKLVIGAEAPLWSEIVTDELVDARLWPRAAALAERFWSPADVRDINDMYRRLAVIADQLTVLGLQDRATRTRLARRLAPGDAEPVETLLSISGPIRNMGHDRRSQPALPGHPRVQSFNALADAAPVDSLAAHRFEGDVRAYLAGDAARAPVIVAQLKAWRDNDERFRAAASGRPILEAALPTSAQIASLAEVGLEAIAARQSGRSLDLAVRRRAGELLAKLEQQEAASALPFAPLLNPQPPADLIVKIGPGVSALVAAASGNG